MTFSRIAKILADGPVGSKGGVAGAITHLRLPRHGVGKWILWFIAPAINLERCRIACVHRGNSVGLLRGPLALPLHCCVEPLNQCTDAVGSGLWMLAPLLYN